MKFLIATFISLSMIGFVGSSHGQSDLEETKVLAEAGDAEAQVKLGAAYDSGRGVPPDSAVAAKWYRLAADQGNVNGQLGLGYILANGRGDVPKNGAEAVKLYRLAAKEGGWIAASSLGLLYYYGEAVPQNFLRAYVWWSISKAQGHPIDNVSLAAEQLTPDQLAQGQEMATRCFESNYRDCE